MATNLALDDKLILRALKAGHHKTKKAAVTAALEEYIKRHEQAKILSLFGEVDYEPEHHYKVYRNRKLK
jgi:hypothetical protein